MFFNRLKKVIKSIDRVRIVWYNQKRKFNRYNFFIFVHEFAIRVMHEILKEAWQVREANYYGRKYAFWSGLAMALGWIFVFHYCDVSCRAGTDERTPAFLLFFFGTGSVWMDWKNRCKTVCRNPKARSRWPMGTVWGLVASGGLQRAMRRKLCAARSICTAISIVSIWAD